MQRKTIELSDRSELDPTTVTIANLARLSDANFTSVVAWLEGERARLKSRSEEAQAVARRVAAEMRADADHDAMKRWAAANL